MIVEIDKFQAGGLSQLMAKHDIKPATYIIQTKTVPNIHYTLCTSG